MVAKGSRLRNLLVKCKIKALIYVENKKVDSQFRNKHLLILFQYFNAGHAFRRF